MRRALLVMVTSLLTACQCGPGVTCSTDSDCPEWGRCSHEGAERGSCVLRQATIPDSGVDAGTDAGTLADAGVDAGVDAGQAVANVSPPALDIPQAGCGASTTGMVTVANTGTALLSVSASTGTSQVFSVAPPSGNVPPGQSLTLTVSALVPATTTAGTDFMGLLTVTTNDSVGRREVPLTARASGVTLTLTPSVVSFGVVGVGTSAAPLSLTLTNAGNVTATLSLSAPVDAQFSLQWTGMPAAVSLAPGASVTNLQAGFTASRAAPSSSSAALSVTQPVCGASVIGIPMSGQGTNGGVGLSTTDVFFGANGRVDCGTRALNKTVTLTNTGNQSFAWTGTLGKGSSSPFTVTPSSGTVPANNGRTVITVATTAIPAQALTSDDAFGDIFTIGTDVANDVSHPIQLHQTANGAILSFAPPSVDFGQVPINTSASAPFAVVNGGNTSALVTLTSMNPKFTVTPASPVAVSASASTPLTGGYAPGTSVMMESSMVQLTLDGGVPLCAPLPAALAMTGQGTSGSVSYSPVALDFGLVNCGATPPANTVTFRNTGNAAYTVTPVLGRDAGSPYVVTMTPASGRVAIDGGMVVITVAPNAIPQSSVVTPNFYADTLTVTTDVASDSPHNIPLRLTARGSIFAISTTSLNFGSVTVGATAPGQFTLSNNGNAPGALVFVAANLAFVVPANALVDAASSSIQSATFNPTSAQTYSDTATITKTSATVLCQPLPAPSLSLSGVGTTGNVVAVSSASLNFGLVPCGSTAPPQTVTITNNSASQLSFAYSLARGGGSPYVVSGPPSLSSGGMGTVTITPKVVPGTSSTVADSFADTLSITGSGGAINEAHTVALHQTAQGAVLTMSPGSLTFTDGQTKNFTVTNSGNISAAYTLALEGTNTRFAVSPTSSTAGSGGSVTEGVTYTKPLLPLTGQADSVTLSSSVGRCAPLPAPVTLSGN